MDEAVETGGRILSTASQDNPQRDQQERPRNRKVAGKPVILPRLPDFFTIGRAERMNLDRAIRRPLSGYIGGHSQGGYWTSRLAEEWCDTFGCRYAIPCNSATTGLLAACMAADVGDGDVVWVSDYTMSASASCAALLGADIKLIDIEPYYFCMDWQSLLQDGPMLPKAIIVTNLFGCAADLGTLRQFCDRNNIILIEDNAQAPFATLHNDYTGTIGHIGVFSLNVHKHIQAGEGGVVVTDDAQLAHRLDCAINHGELMKTNPHMGLNLRMTEPIAAIASAQLRKGPSIVETRIALADFITDCFKGFDFVEPPKCRDGDQHVYYLWAGKITGDNARQRRSALVGALRQRGVPFRERYSTPLHHLFAAKEMANDFPITNEMEDKRLFSFEICAYDPKAHHLKVMKQIIQEEADKLK